MDITPYYVSKYTKGGLSYWVGAARRIGPTAQDWEQRRKAPITYLLKVGSDAVHERLYYVLAPTLNVPQQHVFWAITPPHTDLIGAAIQFEQGASFPTRRSSAGKRDMGKITRATLHLTTEEVKIHDPRLLYRQRWMIIYNALVDPREAKDIAKDTGVSVATVHKLIPCYNKLGVAAVETPWKGGRQNAYISLFVMALPRGH